MAAGRKSDRQGAKAGGGSGRRLVVVARWLLLAITVAVFAGFAMLPVERPPLPPRQGPAIAEARSWGYQLQNVDLLSIADGVDVLVVDYSRDGSERRVLKPAEIERLKIRADGSKRIILAYLSIGEAENYRYYWRRSWSTGSPSWLGPENPEWRGNFAVRYWSPSWRRLIMKPRITLYDRFTEAVVPARRPYLDRIIEAGFDGVYLDRIDAFDTWVKERPSAEADMIAFVESLSAYAKTRRPGFLVVPQNGEELLRSPAYRQAIDAVAKEDLLFGLTGDGQPNGADEIRQAVTELNRLKTEGRPVFVVEYLSDGPRRAEALQQLNSLGYVAQFAGRDLRRIPE